MVYSRDPVSVLFDGGAERLLRRAYARPGRWVGTRLADPAPRHVAHFARSGINVLGGDNAATLSGKHEDMRSRWGRGFARAVYYQHKRLRPAGSRAIVIEVGRRVPVRGVIPAGRAVRIRTRPGGEAAKWAVARKPDDDRIYDDEGEAAGRWADPDRRDWGQ